MTDQYTFQIKKFGEKACLIHFDEPISDELTQYMRNLQNYLLNTYDEYIQDINFSYTEMAVYFTHFLNEATFFSDFKNLIADFRNSTQKFKTLVYEIPVCYDEKYGIDIQEICASKGISKEKFIALHTQPIYPVRFIGFLPGFPYLSGLNEKIAHPRKKSPRRTVPSGAVGIANHQTGIYPVESAGGWNIIGKTAIQLFDLKEEKTLLSAGDCIKFTPVSLEKHRKIEDLINSNEFEIKKYNA